MKPVRGRAKRFVWRRLVASRWADAWEERLAWLGQNLALSQLAGARTVRIEAYNLLRREADLLVQRFGGSIRPAAEPAARDFEPKHRAPLRIRGRLLVVSSKEELAAALKKCAGTPVLVIPAGMAFGTGEHATTATCLRLLADVASRLRGAAWDALDLGTGSGILALAARLLGAQRVEASDFDPVALRVAKENAVTNAIRSVVFRRDDVLEWRPRRKWPVVMANLFSAVLIEAAPQITSAVCAGGWLILSGILNAQAPDVIAAFQKQGCRSERVVTRGKWTSWLARR
jgi:ribosomal protein L11 methyltransferase